MAPPTPHKGRGAASNADGRFEPFRREREHDGWDLADEPDPAPKTVLLPDRARSVITTNDSPDIPFEQSVNVYRGCEHGCPYCLSGDTRILMADSGLKPLESLRAGDRIVGTVRKGWYRRFVETEVRAHWESVKRAYRIRLEDGTTIIASGDHRFLTERGWKHVVGDENGHGRRPHLTLNNKLMGFGDSEPGPAESSRYRLGYLCGIIRGDGHIGSYFYRRAGRRHGNQYRFRLALVDLEALRRSHRYLSIEGVETDRFEYLTAAMGRKRMLAIRTSAQNKVNAIRNLIQWPLEADTCWARGFLAGIFDAEGSFDGKTLRISNSDPEIIDYIGRAMRVVGIDYVLERQERPTGRNIVVVRIVGGLASVLRFFEHCNPAITRKRQIFGTALKSNNRLGVTAVEDLGFAIPMFDITTGTGDFIANGVVSHNCYARPSHAYLGLSPGLDFETRIFYKPDAAKRLEAELARPGYRCKTINLGANTDPYQPAEKKLRVTRSVLEVLARCRHPVGIVTKSAMIRRDLDLLADMARDNLAGVAVSLTSLDADLKRRLEPRTAGPKARLKTMRALSDAGVPVTALIAPVIPAVNESELEALVAAAADNGASRAGYVLLRLPREVKYLFRE